MMMVVVVKNEAKIGDKKNVKKKKKQPTRGPHGGHLKNSSLSTHTLSFNRYPQEI